MEFDQYRPLLFSVAYRMTGSAMEAEDIVQDAWLRFQAAPRERVQHVKAYLVQTVTRLAIDHMKSARVQREQYIGPWLPEPVLTDPHERDETLSLAFLTLLERLNPYERAVFLLREVFDYDYAEIAPIVERNEAACRQLFRRAKMRLAEEARFQPSMEAHIGMMNAFVEVISSGEVERLESLLAEDIAVYSDGGGKAAALKKPLFGRERAATLWRGLIRHAPPDARVSVSTINTMPAFLLWVGETLYTVIALDVEDGKIVAMRNMLNPDKLAYLSRSLATPGAIPALKPAARMCDAQG